MKRLVIILIILMISAAQSGEAKSALKDLKAKRTGPIQIVSDKLDAYNEQRMVVFTGNVVATEGDKVIKSDILQLYYKKEGEKHRKPVKTNAETGDLDRLEAKGNVRITQGSKIVTGEKAVYLSDDQKIIVTGKAVMRDGDNVIKGDRVTVYLDEDRGTVEGGRVSATINPEDKEKKGK